MSQTTQKGRSRKKGVSPMERWRKTKGFWAFLLAFSIAFTNMGSSAINAIAGSEMEREEFRLHVEDIRKAAEEAIENDEPIGEDFFQINGSDQNLVEDYEKLLDADGTLFEIFPEIETVKGTGSIELRAFLRIAEDGDPASYALTGEEELVFLYVNGNDEPAAARLNIDGYQTGFATVRPFETALETGTPQVITGGGSGSSSGTGSDVSEPMYSGENESNEAEENVTESAAEMNGSEAMDSLAAEESAAEGKNEEENAEPPAETAADDSAPVEESEPGENQQEQGEVILPEETLPASTEGMEETEEIAEPETEAEPEIQPEEDDATEEGAEASEEESAVQGEDEIDSNQEEASVQEEQKEDEGEEVENIQLSRSRNQVASVMVSLASSSQAEKDKDSDEEADEEEYAEDDKDKDELSPEDEIFEKKGYLDGKLYNAVSLNETVTARAYVISLEEIGANAEELIEGAHLITYSFEPVGTAELIQAPELVRDEAQVTFGIRPQVGYSIIQATANGQELEQAEGSVVASRSEALRARIASPSDALSTEDQDDEIEENDIIYYTIPSVLEDQEVQIVMVESANGSHPAFHQEKTVNGVTVTVEAKEGILPAGTELTVEEVTEQVEPAIRAKMGGEMEAAISLDNEESSEENADDRADEETGEETEDASNITAVLAYDINLMLNGKKLNNTWGDSNYVTVRFSGDRIEEASKEADKIEIAALETPTETVEAALGGTEEMPVVDHLTADNIELNTEGRQAIEISGDEGVREIEAEVSHFTVYTLVFGENTAGRRITVKVVDENGTDIGEGRNRTITLTSTSMKVLPIAMEILDRDSMSGYYFTRAYVYENGQQVEVRQMRYTEEDVWYEVIRPVGGSERIRAGEEDVYFEFSQNTEITFSANGGTFPGGVTEITANLSSDHTCSNRIPDPSMDDNTPEDGTDNLEFKGWVFGDTNFEFGETPVCSGGTVYALYGVKDDLIESFQENQSLTAHTGEGDPAGTVHQSKQAEWENYEEGIAKVTLTVDGVPGGEGVDVVIVLDKSGSMSPRLTNEEYPERMGPAKEAAMEVINNLLDDPAANNRVAFVPYACGNKRLPDATQKDNEYYPNTHTNDSVGFQTADSEGRNHYLADAIKATDAFGGTCYSDGLNKAYEFIAGSGNYTTKNLNRKAYIIFISDGVPNSNYDNDERIYDARTNLVIQECLKGIYTVGIQMTEQQSGTLRDIAYRGTYSDVSDPDELSGVLSNIAGEIQNAGTNAWFVDEIASDYFTKLTSEELNEYELENSSNVYYETDMSYRKDNVLQSVAADEVVVNIGEITSAVKTYSFYLKVKDPNLLNQEWEKPTNNSITLTYKDINNIHQTVKDQRDDTDETIEIGEPTLERYAEPFVIQKLFDKNEDSSQLAQVEFTLQKVKDYAGNPFAESQSVVTLSAVDDMFNAGNLGLGTYEVREVKTASGYQILEYPIEVVIGLEQDYSATGDEVAVEYPSGIKSMLESTIVVKYNGAEVTQQSDPVSVSGGGKGVYVVNNQSMPKLPETGGPGLGRIKEFGWMLLILAAMMAGAEVQMNRRRRKSG